MRAVWFAAGTAAGVYATSKARRAAEALTVDGIHDRLTGWFAGARVLREELRAGALDKETELRGRLSLVPDERDNLRQITGPVGGAGGEHPGLTVVTEYDDTSNQTGKGDD